MDGQARAALLLSMCVAACGGESAPGDTTTTTTTATTTIPMGSQDDCLDDAGLDPTGEYFSAALPDPVCACIAALDDAPFGPSSDQSATPIPDPDPRLADAAYLAEVEMWRVEVKKTRCGCCHDTPIQGPGVPYWDTAYAPIWVDSASDARLIAMSDPEDMPGLTLPLPDLAPFQAFVAAEIAWRESLRNP
jgi:hypothetical protein